MSGTKKENKKNESKYYNATPIEKLLEDSLLELGSIDITEATRILKQNWVLLVRDLRLLHKEKELNTLVRINEKLLKWLSIQCEKSFADDLDPDLMMFLYSYDFDKNGIVWNIATDFGESQWKNPGLTDKISVLFSSIMHDSQPEYSILGRSSVRCVTKPERNSWVIIDFSPKLIRPTHYTIKHYSSWDTEALRAWTFEGSLDGGKSWKLLSRHINDTGLHKKGVAATWKLSECDNNRNPSVLNMFYSHFRILQTDFNSNKHYYLACSGFEIYGAMKDMDYSGKIPKKGGGTGSLTFIPSYDFDTNGIIYWLGTNRGISPWKNPAIRGTVRVLYSSLAKDSHPGYAAIGREIVRCVTEPKKNSWFMIDLLSIKLIPTHYSMRHYSSFDTECVRSWRLQAANDSKTGFDGHWVTLFEHINDTNLNHKGATHTWSIPQRSVHDLAFSQFKLFQFGANSNQHHYLPLSGFELYGTVVAGHQLQSIMNPKQAYGKMNAKAVDVNQPIGNTRKFVYAFDFDENGLLYFLGTQCGQQRMYTNPMEIGMVTVTASSLMSDSAPLPSFIGRVSSRCVTKPQQRSWMQLHLKDVKIKLTHYTLRHYNSWDTEALRYWNLEGSNDANSWLPIRQHMDDRALRKAGGSHTWAVDTNQFFSHFRLYMTGRNSNNHWYLACSGMELYGTAFGGMVSQRYNAQIANNNQMMNRMMFPNQMMFPQQNAMIMPQQSQSDSFDYNRELDDNGLVYFLGTKCKTQQWQNPAQIGYVAVRTSGLMGDSAPAYGIVGRQPLRIVTKPLKNAWILIDFLEYAIKPTRYTLRHYATWDTEAMRNWQFEGSSDGKSWVVLREHRNDESLRRKGQSFTWSVDKTNQYFTQFRIYQTDKNSNNHYYLACSGFEIYGSVLRQNHSITFTAAPKYKSRHLTVDTLRNTVTNTGSDDTWQTVKSLEPLIYDPMGRNEFYILIESAPNTSNSWKCMVGIAPDAFVCNGSKQWLGSQKSYAYIGGTGGKCYDNPKSIPYGHKWGTKPGQIVSVTSNIKTKTIEFFLDGKSQGIAFQDFNAYGRNMYAAASITATGSRIRLMQRVSPRSKPPSMMPMMGMNMNGMQMPMIQQQMGAPIMQSPASPRTRSRYQWDSTSKSSHLKISGDGVTVTNDGSTDTWQGIVSQMVFKSGRHSFEIHILNDPKTSNQWKYIFGVGPLSFNPSRTAWLGSQNSWGYIGGTGGKCHSVGKSIAYGKKYGNNDRIKCQIDFNKKTIQFFRNDISQGIAFDNLNGPVRPAVSLTGKGASVKICNIRDF